MKSAEKWQLWRRWVLANTLGELFGLGLTMLFTIEMMRRLEGLSGAAGILASFAAAVLSGLFEATVVGLAQWQAMRPWFPQVSRRGWWLGTLGGALAAYVLGYLPSTIMSFGEEAGAAPAQEPAQWIVLLLAAGLGLVAGAVLSFAQWLALRGKARGSGWWIPANMAAWTVGMPLIFWGIDAAQKGQLVWQMGLILAGTLLLAGAVVGAIHGAVLVWIAAQNRAAN